VPQRTPPEYPVPRVMTPDEGTNLPDVPGYEVQEVLGRGGMGVVYRARQLGLGRLVALKMILHNRTSEDDLARFQAEAQAVARLRHPNIIQIHEVGEHQQQPFSSLEFAGGGSLDRLIQGCPPPARDVAVLIRTLALAADHAHSEGIIHRDLKPGNILLVSGGGPAPLSPRGRGVGEGPPAPR